MEEMQVLAVGVTMWWWVFGPPSVSRSLASLSISTTTSSHTTTTTTIMRPLRSIKKAPPQPKNAAALGKRTRGFSPLKKK
jgi:hypothetical protein